MKIIRWNGIILGKREMIDMATISFVQNTIIDNKSADILISQIEKAEISEKRESIFDIEDNMKEGRRLLAKLLSKRQK